MNQKDNKRSPEDYIFPAREQHNPRLDLPMFVRFGHGLSEYIEDKYFYGRRFYQDQLFEFGLAPGQIQGPVLDIGCGAGQWPLVIAEKSPELHVYAVDANDYLLACAEAQKRKMGLKNISIEKENIHDLSMLNTRFKTIICIGVLQLVKANVAMKQMSRLVEPGGRVLINASGLGFYVRNVLTALANRDLKIARQNFKFIKNTIFGRLDAPFTYFTPRRIRKLAAANGLIVEWVKPHGLYPPQTSHYLNLPVNLYAMLRKE